MHVANKVLTAAVMFCLLLISCDPVELTPSNPSTPSTPSTPSESEVKVSGVTLDKTSVVMEIGEEITLVATLQPADASNKKVTWSSSNTAVATVKDGKVSAVAAGKAVITVKTENGGKTATCQVTVNAAPVVSVSGVTLDRTTAEMEVNDEITLVATVLPDDASNKKVIWTTSDDAVVSVDNGNVKALSVGKAVITAKTEDGDKTATCEVTVKATPVTGIELDRTSVETEVGPYVVTVSIKARVLPENATNKNVKWTSSNTYVGKVVNEKYGTIDIYHPGKTTITATTEEGGYTATCAITVKAMDVVKVTGVEMYSKTVNVKVGELFDLAATVIPGNATDRSATWTSSPEGIIEYYNGPYTSQSHGNVSKNFKAVAPGTTIVTVKTTDGGFTDTCVVNVTE